MMPAHDCTCATEPGGLAECPACGVYRLCFRSPSMLSPGDVVAYDPLCGYTVTISPPERGSAEPGAPGSDA